MLPHDIQYFLDSALENSDLNGFDHITLCLFAPSEQVIDIVDKYEPSGKGWRRLFNKCLKLDSLAHETAKTLNKSDQRALFAASMINEMVRLRMDAETLSAWNYEDSVKGGCLLPFKKCRTADKPPKRVEQHLHSRSGIHQYVRQDSVEVLWRYKCLVTPLRDLPWPSHPDEAKKLDKHFEEARIRHEAARQRGIDIFLADKRKALTKPQRNSVKRAVRTATGLLGAATVSAFCRGEPVQLSGPNLDFEIQRSDRVSHTGNGAVRIKLFSEKKRLSNLCLYFEKTPAIDQLTAIALHTQSGDDLELLSTGNLYNITADGATHPLLQSRAKPVLEFNQFIIREVNRQKSQFEINKQEYITKTISAYQDSLISLAWQKDAGKFQRFINLL